MRFSPALLVFVLAACNHDAPPNEGRGSAPAPTSERGSDEMPDTATLPGAALPGGLRGDPKSGPATLADLGVTVDNWPLELKPRWLSKDAVVISILRQPFMLAKTPLATPDLADGAAVNHTIGDREVFMCERTLRGTTYHLEGPAIDPDAAAMAAKLCTALR